MSTSLVDDLDEFDAEEVEEPDPGQGAVALDNADSILRKIRQLDRDRADLEAHAAKEHARVDTWLHDRTAGMEDRRSYLVGQLDRFARAYKLRMKKAPPKLVNGTMRLSGPRVHIEVEDEEAFVAWAKANGHADLVRTKETPAKDEIQKVVKEGQVRAKTNEERRMSAVLGDGEVVPGLVLVKPTEDSFSLTIA